LKQISRPPQFTLITPPPRAIGGALSFAGGACRAPRFRLWPSAKPPARVRTLASPVLVRALCRQQSRAAAVAVLNAVRFMRRSEPERLSRRLSALAAILAKPLRAAQRLAAKLARFPDTAARLALQRPPRSEHTDYALQQTLFWRCSALLPNSS